MFIIKNHETNEFSCVHNGDISPVACFGDIKAVCELLGWDTHSVECFQSVGNCQIVRISRLDIISAVATMIPADYEVSCQSEEE